MSNKPYVCNLFFSNKMIGNEKNKLIRKPVLGQIKASWVN